MPEFVGTLTEDLAILDGGEMPAPVGLELTAGLPEPSLHSDSGDPYWNSNDLTPEQILSDDLEVVATDDDGKPVRDEADEEGAVTLEPIEDSEETEPQQEAKPANKSLNDFQAPPTSPQYYEQPTAQEQTTVTGEAVRNFFAGKIASAVPQLKDVEAGERQKFINEGYVELMKLVAADKEFLARLDKTYNGSWESIERGMNLLIERGRKVLPRALSNLDIPKAKEVSAKLTLAETRGWSFRDILDSMRPAEVRGKWIPHQDAFGASR